MLIEKNELYTATQISRNFSKVIKDITKNTGRAFVLKNNEINCIILSPKEYEKLMKAKELLESIYKGKTSGSC